MGHNDKVTTAIRMMASYFYPKRTPAQPRLLQAGFEISSEELRLDLIQFFDLQFLNTRFYSPNLSKLARADIICQYIKQAPPSADTVYEMNGL
jgi:hypothetical protein